MQKRKLRVVGYRYKNAIRKTRRKVRVNPMTDKDKQVRELTNKIRKLALEASAEVDASEVIAYYILQNYVPKKKITDPRMTKDDPRPCGDCPIYEVKPGNYVPRKRRRVEK
jgi:hypothetical protein